MSSANKEDFDSSKLGGSWKRKIVNPDLEEERKKCTFDQDELFKFVFTDRCYKFIKEMNQLMEEHPEFHDKRMDRFDMTREEKFDEIWRQIHLLMKYKPDIFIKNDAKYWYGWCYYFGEPATPIYQH